jgi:Mg2+-importing ATPase
VPPPLSYFPWLAATLVTCCAVTQSIEACYIRKFGMWL